MAALFWAYYFSSLLHAIPSLFMLLVPQCNWSKNSNLYDKASPHAITCHLRQLFITDQSVKIKQSKRKGRINSQDANPWVGRVANVYQMGLILK